MGNELTRVQEAQRLADAMFDRHFDVTRLERLEELIATDLVCLQAYVERLSFHGDMVKQATERSSEVQAKFAMDRILGAQLNRERRGMWAYRLTVTASLLLFCIVTGWMVAGWNTLPPRIGTITSLTVDVNSDGSPPELGQVIRKGEVFTLREGIASFQLPHVSVDLIAPATVRMNDSSRLELQNGVAHVFVRAGGEGFAVQTPDSVVVDLGTEFVVEYLDNKGTEVSVRRGRVQASLLGRNGQATKSLEITNERSAVFSRRDNSIREVNFTSGRFQKIDQTRGQIASIDGALRTLPESPESLQAGKLTTSNHMLVVPEQQNVVLDKDLTLNSLSGDVQLPAGSRISSYVVHYDPTDDVSFSPRGSVTFHGKIAALIGTSDDLNKTDSLFGLPKTTYESQSFRKLELDEDEFQISEDRSTASFYFGVSPPEYLDEIRILVIE